MNNERNDMDVSPTTPGSGTSGSGRRRGVAVGLAGGLLAGTAAGLVFGVPGLSSAASDSTPTAVVQQTDETDPSTPAPSDTDPATPAPAEAPDGDEAPEMGTKLREALQPLVDDGTITAEQADAVTKQLVESRPERGEGGSGGPGGHRGGPGGGMLGRGGPGMGSEALTGVLGLTAEEIHTQLHDGKTLAEIATAQGVEVQAVVDTLVAELDTRLDEAVADGRIDQAEADTKLADAETKITDMVNNGRPDRGGPMGGPMGDVDTDAPADTAD